MRLLHQSRPVIVLLSIGKVMTTPLESFRALVLETAPLVANAQALVRLDDDAWLMVFADEAGVEFHVNEQLRKTVLCMSLGPPEETQRAAVYHMVLVMSGLWRETGGLRFALEEPEGAIEMCLDLNLDDLDPQKLATLVQSFADRGRVWQDLIAAGQVQTEPPQECCDNRNPDWMMRV